MLRATFLHLPGVGPRREQSLWRSGVRQWAEALELACPPGFSPTRWDQARRILEQSLRAADASDHTFFASRLRPRYHWRALPDFRRRIAYLDIETTGAGPWAEVTVIGVYDGLRTHTFVHGESLECFPDFIDQFAVIVTFNGSTFDLPVLRRYFRGLRFHQLHVDLRWAFYRLGFTGGLKAIEQRLGVQRAPDLQGLTGEDAVRLWFDYLHGDDAALDTLIRYNAADVENLEALAAFAYRQLWEKCQRADLSAY